MEALVRVEGLEPPRREALDPKSSMSTNFITPACCIKLECKYIAFFLFSNL